MGFGGADSHAGVQLQHEGVVRLGILETQAHAVARPGLQRRQSLALTVQRGGEVDRCARGRLALTCDHLVDHEGRRDHAQGGFGAQLFRLRVELSAQAGRRIDGLQPRSGAGGDDVGRARPGPEREAADQLGLGLESVQNGVAVETGVRRQPLGRKRLQRGQALGGGSASGQRVQQGPERRISALARQAGARRRKRAASDCASQGLATSQHGSLQKALSPPFLSRQGPASRYR